MTYTIKKLLPEHAEQVLEYLSLVFGETNNLNYDARGIPGMTLEKERELLEQMHTERSTMLGAFDGDLLIGIANIGGAATERTAHRAGIGMSVRKAYWRKKVGSQLMEALIDFARQSPVIEQMELTVLTHNEAAIALYKKYGFRIYGELEHAFKIGKVYHSFYLMVLDLGKHEQDI